MPDVNVILAGTPIASSHPHVTISGGRTVVTLPSTSPEYSLGGLARQWKPIPRAGELYRPLLARSGRQLSTLSLEVVADSDAMGTDVEALISELVGLSDSRDPLVVAYGTLTSARAVANQGTWRLTGIEPSITKEAEGTNRVITATIKLQFTEASDLALGGVKGDPAGPVKAQLSADAPRRYKVKAGESLQDIAARFLGNADLWRGIADANKIRDPSPTAIVGKTLTLS